MAVWLCPVLSFSHGTSGIVEQVGLTVAAQYDTGEAMSYAKVTVSAPNAELPFQSGRTDRNGRFCFFPDVSGEWKLVVDDEMGHRLEMRIPVSGTLGIDKKAWAESKTAGISKFTRMLMGLCLIFGASGLVFWWKATHKRSALC
jgi:nickel transport protein